MTQVLEVWATACEALGVTVEDVGGQTDEARAPTLPGRAAPVPSAVGSVPPMTSATHGGAHGAAQCAAVLPSISTGQPIFYPSVEPPPPPVAGCDEGYQDI